ncbi:MAG: hypothetical protein ACK4UN_02625 [Limisphaerales bacterium]
MEALYFIDDIPGGFGEAGYHYTPTENLATLFSQLERDKRVIIADVHTHPGKWVGLSKIDMENPIEFRRGLPAIVLPHFAAGSPSLARCGVHEYLGRGEWRELSIRQKNKLFRFVN